MEKFVQMKSLLYKLFLVVTPLVVAGFLAVSPASVRAADNVPRPNEDNVSLPGVITCSSEKTVFDKVKEALLEPDIRRTATNHMVSLVIDGAPFIGWGKGNSEMQKCGVSFMEKDGIDVQSSGCEIEDNKCDDLSMIYSPNSGFANTQVSGSLLGMSNFFQGVTINEPMPVNLAFWWNDNVARIPFAEKALAADVTYSGPMLNVILVVWKAVRDIAYGIMAIVMLVIGFMIITKKKIGAQVAVTAQLAIPKIITALILITFSYPIGALGVSAAYVMQGNANDVVSRIDWGSDYIKNGFATNSEWSLGRIIAVFYDLNFFIGSGVVSLIIIIVSCIIALVLWILAFLKLVMVYIKLLFSIITSPITFAIGAIPGQEATTAKWFKQFIARALSLPVVVFVIHISWALSWKAITVGFTGIQGFNGNTLAFMMVPLILIYGVNFARGIPEKLETAIVGEEKKPRR